MRKLWFAIAGMFLAGYGAQVASGGEPAASKPAAVSAGKRVFDRWCTECHGDGPRYPGTAALASKYGKDLPAVLEQRTDLTPEVVAMFVRKGVSVMPPFRKTEITDAELAALGTHLSREPAAAVPSAR